MTWTVSTRPRSPVARPTAATARAAAVLLPVLRPTVAAAVVVKNGRVLRVQRADNGEWTFPAGGAETDETPQQAAAREVLEETGLVVVALVVLGQRIHPVTGVCIVYVACWPLSGDAHVASPREVATVEWTDVAALNHRFLHGVFGPAGAYLHAGGSSERTAVRSVQ